MRYSELEEKKTRIMNNFIEELEKYGTHEINTTEFLIRLSGSKDFNSKNLILASKVFRKRGWIHKSSKNRNPTRYWVYIREEIDIWKI